MNNDGVWKMWKTILICSYYEFLWIYFHLYHWFVDIKSLFVNELYSFPQLMNVVDKMMWKSRVGECSVQNCCLSGGIYCIFSTHFLWFLDGVEKWWLIIIFSISYPQVFHNFIKECEKCRSMRVYYLNYCLNSWIPWTSILL